jgi:hypothetical protein
VKKIVLTVVMLSILAFGASNAAVANPHGLRESGLWYAPALLKNFPSQIRVCGFETQIDAFSLFPRDITKFRLSSSVKLNGQMVALDMKGSVAVGSLAAPFKAIGKKNKYVLYVEAFLFAPDGRLYDVQSNAPEGGPWVSSKGGKADISMFLGSGYDFDMGGRVLLVASGEPISSVSGDSECVVLGAKWISIK